MVFPAQAVLECKLRIHAVGILCKKCVLHREAIVVVRHLVDSRVMRDAEQEVGKWVSRECAVEIILSVIVAAEEA